MLLLAGLFTTGCLPNAGSKAAAGADAAKAARSPAAQAAGARARGHLVELASVRRGTLSLSRVYTGSLRARRVHRVHAQEVGSITALPSYEGDQVRAGSVILRLDRVLLETELAKAQAMRKELEGLNDGDRVVTKGFLGLVPGARVTPVAGAADGGGEHSGTPGSKAG
jgi:multidrug efflux pump subunit AcrA (membrane-fusion protein)